MLDLLEKDHRQLAELSHRIEACLDRAGPYGATRLGQLRCAFAHEAVRHTIVEDKLVYQVLDTRDPEWMAEQRDAHPCLRTASFLDRLERHIHRWDAAPGADRRDAAAETKELLRLLRTRMTLEEQILYPRLRALQADRARPRRSRGAASTVEMPPV